LARGGGGGAEPPCPRASLRGNAAEGAGGRGDSPGVGGRARAAGAHGGPRADRPLPERGPGRARERRRRPRRLRQEGRPGGAGRRVRAAPRAAGAPGAPRRARLQHRGERRARPRRRGARPARGRGPAVVRARVRRRALPRARGAPSAPHEDPPHDAGARGVRRLVLLMLLLAASVPAARGQSGALRDAKELFFDRKYSEARQAWQAVAREGRPEAGGPSHWIARCSESLGEYERALGEYGTYLAARPTDRTLAEEARTSRVGLASRLYKAGAKQHLGILTDALADPARTVRYFAALQLSQLGPAGRPAVPVLKKIVAEEKDEDLVERAKLGLLRLEPGALAPAASPAAAQGVRPGAGGIRARVFQKGGTQPKASLNLPPPPPT